MANALYNSFKEALLSGSIDLTSENIKIVAVDTSGGTNYTFSQTHTDLDDVAAGARRATSPNLASKTITNGIFDAADITDAFASLSGGDIEALILYVDSGVESTSHLIAYYDTGGGLPFSPTGNNTDLLFSGGSLFSL